uniref:ATP synthase subunit a n=1 Tax=Limnia unguicornis TaxID=1226590 RepID=A0A7D6W3S5_9MUSC|nr:ATP synthase F0 subunit 6 [Limnia unguicornis]
MMTNLFSIFDPSSSVFCMSLNWLSTLIGLLLVPSSFWLIPSRYHFIWSKLMLSLHVEFKTLLGNSQKGGSFIFVSLFSMVMFNNFMGLFPYVFTSTSHLSLTLSVALPLWFSFMIFGWLNNAQHMFAHLVPQGTPPALMPFMVCIETISNLIRPGTLAVRLTANMIAGHLLLTLMGNTGVSLSGIMIYMLIAAQLVLLSLEMAVAVIQAYVISVLSTLYSSETS